MCNIVSLQVVWEAENLAQTVFVRQMLWPELVNQTGMVTLLLGKCWQRWGTTDNSQTRSSVRCSESARNGGVTPCALRLPPESSRQGTQVWCAVTASESEAVPYFVPTCEGAVLPYPLGGWIWVAMTASRLRRLSQQPDSDHSDQRMWTTTWQTLLNQ